LAVGLCKQNVVQEGDIHFMQLSSTVFNGSAKGMTAPVLDMKSSAMSPIEQYEADFIANLIEKYQGNRKLIAAEMNISERTLYRKLNRLNLN